LTRTSLDGYACTKTFAAPHSQCKVATTATSADPVAPCSIQSFFFLSVSLCRLHLSQTLASGAGFAHMVQRLAAEAGEDASTECVIQNTCCAVDKQASLWCWLTDEAWLCDHKQLLTLVYICAARRYTWLSWRSWPCCVGLWCPARLVHQPPPRS